MEHELKTYNFDLPKRLIAQRPARPRDHSRLLVYRRTDKSITDDYFYNLAQHLPSETTLVLNNSKVDKARLKFAGREVFMVKNINQRTVEALVFPGRQFQPGESVELAPGISARVLKVLPDGQRCLEFNVELSNPRLDKFKQTPFPPYIKPDESLSANYQTVYSKQAGSKAAPTAGLHFTKELLRKLRASHEIAEVTLHVGLGTFAPLKLEQLKTGKLHEEQYSIDADAAKVLNQAKHITAVGTTTARVLESAVKVQAGQRSFSPKSDSTDIFIQPGYEFQAVDSLITNFHLPKSSLLMIVSALVGIDEMQRIYAHAIKNEYRFYSFGDAMLII